MPRLPICRGLFFAVLLCAGGAGADRAVAQTMASTCLAMAQDRQAPRVLRAAFEPGAPAAMGQRLAQLASDEVRIAYVGHSAFRIETPGGVAIVTDYDNSAGAGGPPTIVTMNHAHDSHYTSTPDPAIAHVLRGWNPDGPGPARHRLEVGDVLVRNVPTDLYSNGVMIEQDGNSIFIFEVAGLCIGHLGHLHHTLTPDHIARIGRIDVLFVPVDGTYTMSQGGMIDLAGQLRSSIVIPMHFFSIGSLQRFVAGMQDKFETNTPGGNTITVSARTLPSRPTVTVLLPY